MCTRNNSSLSGHAQQRMPFITVQNGIAFGLVMSLNADSVTQVLFVIAGLQEVVTVWPLKMLFVDY